MGNILSVNLNNDWRICVSISWPSETSDGSHYYLQRMVLKAKIEQAYILSGLWNSWQKYNCDTKISRARIFIRRKGESEPNSVNWQRATSVCRKWACTRVGGEYFPDSSIIKIHQSPRDLQVCTSARVTFGVVISYFAFRLYIFFLTSRSSTPSRQAIVCEKKCFQYVSNSPASPYPITNPSSPTLSYTLPL